MQSSQTKGCCAFRRKVSRIHFFKMSVTQFSLKIRCKAKQIYLFRLVIPGKLEIDFLSKNNSCRSITAVTEKLKNLRVKHYRCLGVCIQVLCVTCPRFLWLFCVITCYRCLSVHFQMLCEVVHSFLCLLAVAICCLVSFRGLSQGPLCLYNTTSGPTWGIPLKLDPEW